MHVEGILARRASQGFTAKLAPSEAQAPSDTLPATYILLKPAWRAVTRHTAVPVPVPTARTIGQERLLSRSSERLSSRHGHEMSSTSRTGGRPTFQLHSMPEKNRSLRVRSGHPGVLEPIGLPRSAVKRIVSPTCMAKVSLAPYEVFGCWIVIPSRSAPKLPQGERAPSGDKEPLTSERQAVRATTTRRRPVACLISMMPTVRARWALADSTCDTFTGVRNGRRRSGP